MIRNTYTNNSTQAARRASPVTIIYVELLVWLQVPVEANETTVEIIGWLGIMYDKGTAARSARQLIPGSCVQHTWLLCA